MKKTHRALADELGVPINAVAIAREVARGTSADGRAALNDAGGDLVEAARGLAKRRMTERMADGETLEAITSAAQRQRRLAAYERKVVRAEKRIERAQDRVARAQQALDKFDTREGMMARKRTWNLGTSLKSYIDPRVYYEWGQRVDYDVLEKYYPKALRRKFAWVRTWKLEDSNGTQELRADGAEAESITQAR